MTKEEKAYKKGQVDLFNRLYDAAFKRTTDNFQGLKYLLQELNKVRDELKKP